jgi:hypothetical protein
MRNTRVWPCETEDNLRITPRTDRDWRPAVTEQYVASGLDRRPIDVRANQKRAPLDPLFPPRGFTGVEPGVLERA